MQTHTDKKENIPDIRYNVYTIYHRATKAQQNRQCNKNKQMQKNQSQTERNKKK